MPPQGTTPRHGPSEARALIEALGLEPHPEGGFFRETWRSSVRVPGEALPAAYAGPRSAGTAIYYLLTAASFSAFHRITTDEVFHFYAGDPVGLWVLPAGGSETRAGGAGCTVLGPRVDRGMQPQAVVPAGAWQGLRLEEGGAWALLGATVAPGFDFADFEMARRADLAAAYPGFTTIVEQLTRA